MWFLSQGGQQFGPYSTAQLHELVAARRAYPGWVCAQGEATWTPIEQHAAFAQSVARVMGSAAALVGVPTPTRPRSPAGPLLMVAVGMFVLAIVLAIVASMQSRSAGALARWVPRDTAAFVEVADVPAMLEAMTKVGFLDEEKIDTSRAANELAEDLRDAFQTERDTARAMLDDVRSVGFASRGTGDRREAALLLAFASDDTMGELLETKRFEREEQIGDSGQRYSVWLERGSVEDQERWSTWRRLLSSVELGRGSSSTILVWVADQRLLIAGSRELVEDIVEVVDGDAESLAQTDAWQAAQFLDGSRAIAYLDSASLQDADAANDVARAVFDRLPVLSASMHVDDDGTLASMRGELEGAPITEEPLPEPEALTLPRRLPATTIAYLALDPMKPLTGDAVQDGLKPGLDAGLEGMLVQAAEHALSAVWKDLGRELVVAVTASKALRFDGGTDVAGRVDGLAIGVVARLADRRNVEEQLRLLRMSGMAMGSRATNFEPFEIQATDSSMQVSAKGSVRLSLRIELVDEDLLVIALGGRALVDDFVRVVGSDDDDERITRDEAHERAFSALSPDARAFAWIDAARLLQLLPAETTGASPELMADLGLSTRALVLDGEDRLTYSAALYLEQDGKRAKLEVKLRNADPFTTALAGDVVGGLLVSIDRLAEQTQAAIMHSLMMPSPQRGLF